MCRPGPTQSVAGWRHSGRRARVCDAVHDCRRTSMLEKRRSLICQGQTRRKAGTQSFRSVGLTSPTIAGPPNRNVGPAAPAGSTSTPLTHSRRRDRRSRAADAQGVAMDKNVFRGRACRWVLAAALLAMLGGCGDDDEDKSASQSPAPGGSAPPPPSAPRAGSATPGRDARMDHADDADQRLDPGRSRRLSHPLRQERDLARSRPSRSATRASPAYVVEGLAPGTYYFAVTAFNSRNLESERSNAGRKEIT